MKQAVATDKLNHPIHTSEITLYIFCLCLGLFHDLMFATNLVSRIEYDSAALVLKTISDRECHTLYTSINDCRSLMFADWNCHLVHVCQRNHILQDPHSSFMFTVIICLFHHVYHAWNNLLYVLLCLIHSLNHQTHGKFNSLCVLSVMSTTEVQTKEK